MVRKDINAPFVVEQKKYDPSELIKIRIISTDKWDHIDWKTGDLIDPDGEIKHYPVGMLFIHGGAFISGSSSSYQNILKKYALETRHPVFAVDYRLAPDHPYPVPLSDGWLSYLWLRYYSEKYLRVKFDKIILVGDSAGGCISLSISTLAIRKQVAKPDGMALAYPGTGLDRRYFSPSGLMSLDEPYLNAFLIDLGLKSYVEDPSISGHYLGSPLFTPKKYLKEMPPTRVGIAGVDPLRDTGIELVKKLVKAGVNCSGKVYKQLFHGYLEMDSYPFYMKDCEKAFMDTVVFIEEILSV